MRFIANLVGKATDSNSWFSFGANMRSDAGQAISEYLVILGVIVIACILLAVAFQGELSTLWGTVTSSMGSIG